MEVQFLVASPDKIIQRVGSIRHGGPLAWPSLSWVRGGGGGNERFDDPRGEDGQYTVLYGAAIRRACFAETLDQYRLGHAWVSKALEAVAPIPSDDEENLDDPGRDYIPKCGQIPGSYFTSKRLGFFRIKTDKPFLDARITATETADALSVHPDMVALLKPINVPRIKPSDFVGLNRRLTQAISLWAYSYGYAGLVYTSSHNLEEQWECWALFPETFIEEAAPTITIDRTDPDLLRVLERFQLEVDTLDLMFETL